jgi:hypothetical protein
MPKEFYMATLYWMKKYQLICMYFLVSKGQTSVSPIMFLKKSDNKFGIHMADTI